MERIRILIVEDEGLVIRDIENMAKGLGYEICGTASSGEEAIRKAYEMKPDLVLMDIIIKGPMDGITAAEKIWDSFNIPVIYVTAYADENTLRRAKSTEPFGYILKPFDERELKIAIEMAFYKSKMDLKLKEREEWLSTILRSIGDAVIAADQEGLITFMNPMAERLTEWNQEEALGKPINAIFSTIQEEINPEPGRSGEKDFFKESIDRAAELLLFSKSGSRLPIEKSLTSIATADKETRGSVLVFRDITEQRTAEKELKESWRRLQRALEGAIEAIALTIEIRDPYTAGHQRRVSKLSCAIATEMGLSPDQIQGIRVAGDIHDIGKISVPAEILSKPGRISEIEFGIIKTHPQIGYDILKTIVFPWPVAQIVLQHHERINGSGYPAGIKGREMLIESRILSVADTVEAMSSHRPYRPAQGIEKALGEILENKGVFYDSEVVDACLKLFSEKRFSFDLGKGE